MQVQIKFIVSGANSVCGGFVTGDTARIDAAFAKHLVDDAKCAEYVTAQPEAPAEEAAKPAKKAHK